MKFFTPDYSRYPDSPFARDADNNLIRKAYWYDMLDDSIVTLFTLGIGKDLSNEEKKNHLKDIKREHLVDKVCTIEILPPED